MKIVQFTINSYVITTLNKTCIDISEPYHIQISYI